MDGEFSHRGFFEDPDIREYYALEDKGNLTAEERARQLELWKTISRDKTKKDAMDTPPMTLKDFYRATELYAAYPELGDVKVRLVDSEYELDGADGAYDHENNTIKLNKRLSEEALKSALLHEIQHAIQHREGFARGGSPLTFSADGDGMTDIGWWTSENHRKRAKELWDKLSPEAKKIAAQIDLAKAAKNWDLVSELEAKLSKEEQDILWERGGAQQRAYDIEQEGERVSTQRAYERLAGEVEARNASRRMDMTAEERRNTLLAETEDVAREDQIVLMNALGVAESRGPNNEPRGRTELIPERRDDKGNIVQEAQAIVTLLQNADASTPVHEAWHIFMDRMKRMSMMEDLSPEMRQHWQTLADWLHVRDIDFSRPLTQKERARWRDAHEKGAAGFEKYLATGKAPSNSLKQAFEAFRKWMLDIYQSVKNIVWQDSNGKERRFDLPRNIREMFDSLMTMEERYFNDDEDAEGAKSVAELAGEANERIEESLPPKEDPRNLGAVAPGFRPKVDPDTNPLIERGDPPAKKGKNNYAFEDENTEARYREAEKGVEPVGFFRGLARDIGDFFRGFKGDYPLLAGRKELISARETLRRLNRERGVAAQNTVTMMRDALKDLTPEEFDLFARKRLLDDLAWRKQEVPDAALPFGFTDRSLAAEVARFNKLVEGNERVKKAIEAEEKAIQDINDRMIAMADELGWTQLRDSLKNPHYFRHQVLEYARFDEKNEDWRVGMRAPTDRGYLKRYKGSEKDINANYIQANGKVRAWQMQDIAMLEALVDLKKEYDIGEQVRDAAKRQKKKVKDLIPEGYVRWTPFGRGLVFTADTAAAHSLDAMLGEGAKQLGLPFDDVMNAMDKAQDSTAISRMWIIPKELAATLNKVGEVHKRSPFGRAMKRFTTAWKRWVLYTPTRVLSYNIRNVTGDADAMIAGNPRGLAFVPQAMRELSDVYFRGRAATGELHEFQQRGGALTTESVQELYDWGQMKEFRHLMDKMRDADMSAWKKLNKRAWGVIDGYWKGAETLTNFREQILRYATYLSYLDQMRNDKEGRPANWGASNPDEVMAVKDLRDRAFKMSNELLGAYDQVSQTGQQLRDISTPFYSWLEVNAKRYYNLLRNGVDYDTVGGLADRLMKAGIAKTPIYAYRGAKTMFMLNLFSWAVQAFNRFVMGDEEDDLTPDIQDRPHIVLGRDKDGRVLYFDRIGAMADVLDWFALDSFNSDLRDILNGQQTVAGYLKKMGQAPISKAINAMSPALTMPIEMLMKRSMFPDAFHPRTIRDIGTYIASSLGLTWEYRAATGAPGPKYFSLDRLKALVSYSADVGEISYFHILDKKREYQERVLGRSFDGYATSKRGNALRRLRTAMRFKDQKNIDRALKEYEEAGGTQKGLNASLNRMNPLSGLSKEDQPKFIKWLTNHDRRILDRAMKYYQDMLSLLDDGEDAEEDE